MEIKDVVKGERVKVIADSDNLIPIGATWTLIESDTGAPYVNFDEHYEACFEQAEYTNVRALGCHELEEIEWKITKAYNQNCTK